MRIPGLVLAILAVAMAERASAQTASYYLSETRTLSQAIDLAGPLVAGLPISLVNTMPTAASAGVEAWTSYDDHGRPRQIFLYTQSDVFRCANRHPTPTWQCRLKLASIIVHEAVHFRGSRGEAEAYDRQIAFLIHNGASPDMISGVKRAREYVVARQRRRREEKVSSFR